MGLLIVFFCFYGFVFMVISGENFWKAACKLCTLCKDFPSNHSRKAPCGMYKKKHGSNWLGLSRPRFPPPAMLTRDDEVVKWAIISASWTELLLKGEGAQNSPRGHSI